MAGRRIGGARPPARAAVALGALLVSWLVCTGSARALTLLPLDLGALTDGAGRIFVGRVERIDTGRDATGVPAVWTTFAVEETVKGAAGAQLTLKQLGTTFGASDGRVLPHAGLPRFQTGESVVLFVHPESPLGFTSPVGFGQGCFRIREHAGGRIVENDVGNRNLAATASTARAHGGPSPATAPTEPLPLAHLLDQVRARVRGGP